MNFTEYLNFVYSKLDCSQTELCNASNLSAPVISRYLSGDRQPVVDSDQLKALANGIHELAVLKQLDSSEFEFEALLSEFNNSIMQRDVIYNSFVDNFNHVISSFNIHIKDLATALNFDVSYLYRVKSGERHPVDLNHFCELVSDYVVSNANNENNIKIASELLSCDTNELNNLEVFKEKLCIYLTTVKNSDSIPEMDSFLNKMDEFDLDEYIKLIHFDELKIPNIPFQLPSSKYYYGLEDMRKAELDFIKATVLGKSKEPVTMCSYMPMQELAEDMDFGKKWMFGLAMMIKKGLHLNVIHNLDRPMHELMLGFEAWIPIYMTGQVSPYHIPNYSSKVFHQINDCSGSAALMGECIDGFYEDGRYYVTNNKTELSYFRKKANALLKNAEPLMDIYTVENRDKFSAFLKKGKSIKANRRIISSSLPDFTIPESIIKKYISGLEENTRDEITTYINEIKSSADEILKHNILTCDIHELTREEYEKSPVKIDFPTIFSDFNITLTYEEYLDHLNATKELEKDNSNFELNYVDHIPFTNIKIIIVSGKYFIISKAKSPNIHFVIYHKKMLEGMENFYIAYTE